MASPPAGFNPTRHRLSIMRPVAAFTLRGASKSYSNQGDDMTDNAKLAHVKLENTYKMAPDDNKRFQAHKVQNVAAEVLRAHLQDEKYSLTDSPRVARDLSNLIKEEVKALGFKRYKFVVEVLISQRTDQALNISSRCIWDDKSDSFATATFKNASLCAVAVVFGIYFE